MSQQPTSIVAIRRRLNEDLYLNFAGMSETEAGHALLQVYVNPLVSCIWLGFWIVFFGTITCLVPSKVKLAYARTEVVGVYEKKTTASK
jgi:cytochrome c-type biogenesis protein CcmF